MRLTFLIFCLSVNNKTEKVFGESKHVFLIFCMKVQHHKGLKLSQTIIIMFIYYPF